MKVLLTGAKGMLAGAILNKKPREWDLRAVDIEELDITDRAAVQEMVLSFAPQVIINCAAFTRVDECEEKKELAFAVNGAGVGHLAEAACQTGAYFVHFSTDYIFDGSRNQPYREEDMPCPVSVYGASKWEGECQIRKHLKDYLIIRTQWLYGRGGTHFVNTILSLAKKQEFLKVVNDQVGSPTWTEDLAEGALALVEQRATGEYHLVNEGHCSWYQFASRIIEEAALPTKVTPCTTAEFPRPAKRPAYSVLSTDKAKRVLERGLPHWEVALKRFMRSV